MMCGIAGARHDLYGMQNGGEAEESTEEAASYYAYHTVHLKEKILVCFIKCIGFDFWPAIAALEVQTSSSKMCLEKFSLNLKLQTKTRGTRSKAAEQH